MKDKKLQEMVLYISEKCQGDETYGATKQNKLLFYSDFLAYLNFGTAISDQEYFRLPQGPCPRRWLPVKGRMVTHGDIKVTEAEFCGFPQKRTVPLRKADLSIFNAQEVALMDKVVELHWGKTASEISDESHGFLGWQLAEDKETIPYSVALVSNRKLNETDLEYGKSLQQKAVAALNEYGEGCPED